jgi:CRP-like cAMP-binding protein
VSDFGVRTEKQLQVAVPLKQHLRMVKTRRMPVVRRFNRLLARLPADDLRSIQRQLITIPLHSRQRLQKQGERVEHVYFPTCGVVSVATSLSDGASVEAATIGDEGLVGIEALFSDDAVSSCDAIVQAVTPHESAEMMRVADFRRELGEHAAFADVVGRYAQALHGQLTRLTACNARHDVNERCARWLLMANDHMHGEGFHLSQECLAEMLGVRRQSVSAVAGVFQAAGFIQYTHGHIAVTNREGLEAVACECYAAIRALYARL